MRNIQVQPVQDGKWSLPMESESAWRRLRAAALVLLAAVLVGFLPASASASGVNTANDTSAALALDQVLVNASCSSSRGLSANASYIGTPNRTYSVRYRINGGAWQSAGNVSTGQHGIGSTNTIYSPNLRSGSHSIEFSINGASGRQSVSCGGCACRIVGPEVAPYRHDALHRHEF